MMDGESPKNLRAVVLKILCAVVGLWVLSALCIYWGFSSWQDRSQFGDMFGAINALYSGLALAGVIVAIILQNQELALQRKEIELNRHELARTATAQEETRAALGKQVELMTITTYAQALIGKIDADYQTSRGTPPEKKDLMKVIERMKAEVEKFDA